MTLSTTVATETAAETLLTEVHSVLQASIASVVVPGDGGWGTLVILNATYPALTCVVYPQGFPPTRLCERHDLPPSLVSAIALFLAEGLNQLGPADAVEVDRALRSGGQLLVLVDPIAVQLEGVLVLANGRNVSLFTFGLRLH